MYDLIFFYVPHAEERVANGNYALMDLMLASARKVGFQGELIFYTHDSARLPDDLPVTRVVRIAPKNVAVGDVMLLKAHAHHHFVNSDSFRRPAISVESDQLFQRDPVEAFALPFDIGLTYADTAKYVMGDYGKINGGVTYFNHEDVEAVRSYFALYIDRYLEMRNLFDPRFPGKGPLAQWGGDEIVQIKLLPADAFDDPSRHRQQLAVAGARIMLLDSITFNCQQGKLDENGVKLEFYPKTIIRHFLGWRRANMPDYADRFLGLRLEPCTESSWGTKVAESAVEKWS